MPGKLRNRGVKSLLASAPSATRRRAPRVVRARAASAIGETCTHHTPFTRLNTDGPFAAPQKRIGEGRALRESDATDRHR